MESVVLDQALAATLPPEALALMGFVGFMGATVLLTWLVLRSLLLPYADSFAPAEQLLFLRLENTFNGTVLVVLKVPAGTLEALESIYNNVLNNLVTIVAVTVLALGALAVTEYQPQLTMAYLKTRACTIVPFVDDVVLRLINLARLLYDALYAFVNVGAELAWAATSGARYVLKACTSFAALGDIFVAVGHTLEALAQAIGTFLANGGLFDERFVLVPALYELGLGANAALGPLQCLCAALDPLWTFVVALPQLTSLHTLLDCAANVPIRFLQALFTAVTNWAALDWNDLAVELTCTDVAVGLVAEEVAVLATTFLGDLLDLIPLGTGMMDGAGGEGSATVQTRDDKVSLLSSRLHAARLGPPLWDLPPGTNLSDLLGIDGLLRLVSTPWSGALTQPIAAAIALGNMTLNAISHGNVIFETPDGLAYFQVKGIFDRLRAAVDAAAQALLSVIFSDATACALSLYGQAALTYVEGACELFFVVLYAAIFPRWLPGGQSLANCSVHDTCSGANAPVDWTIFNVFPAYYTWEGNALNRTLTMLLDNATCLGAMFGCNTTAEPDCRPDYPFQCALITTHRLAVDLVNMTNAVLFLAPDLARFDASRYHTFMDVAPALLFQRIEDLIDCLVGTCAPSPLFSLSNDRSVKSITYFFGGGGGESTFVHSTKSGSEGLEHGAIVSMQTGAAAEDAVRRQLAAVTAQ